MFGKRSTFEATSAPRPVAPPAPAPQARVSAPPLPAGMGQALAKAERKPIERARPEEYYDVKTTVFNALIDTIDLTQLSKLIRMRRARRSATSSARSSPSRMW